MDQYTADEALTLITGGSEYMSDEESDIEEDSEFLLPHNDDKGEAELEVELDLTGTLSPPTLSAPPPFSVQSLAAAMQARMVSRKIV